MAGRIGIEVTGRASRANMMHMFTDEKEKRISTGQRQEHRPPGTCAETFGQNRKDCHAQKCSGGETNQRAKLFVRELQRRADPSPGNGESISRNDLPERSGHSGACHRLVIFAAKMRLDGDVNYFDVRAEQGPMGIAALLLVRHDRADGRKFLDAYPPYMYIAQDPITSTF